MGGIRWWLLLLWWVARWCSAQIMPLLQESVIQQTTGQATEMRQKATQSKPYSATWQASALGAALSRRDLLAESAPLSAAEPVRGIMTLVTWRYLLSAPPPPGLQVQLCAVNRCVRLDGQSGSTQGFNGIAAKEALRFVWQVPGNGALVPVMQVLSNQLIVNYIYY